MTKTAPTTTGYYWAHMRDGSDFEPVHLVVNEPRPDAVFQSITYMVFVTGCEMTRGLEDVMEWGDPIVRSSPEENRRT